MKHRVLAGFRTEEALRKALRSLRDAGVEPGCLDVLSPVPLEGLEGLEARRSPVYPAALVGGVVGLVGSFGLQEWISAVRNPYSVGARPLSSVLAWVPVTFESMVLLASLAAFGAFLVVTRLPQPSHPLLELPEVTRASRDEYVLVVVTDRPDEARRRLANLGVAWVST